MPTQCKQETFRFQDLGRRRVDVDFGGGFLSSDGGALFLRAVEARHGVIRQLASCFEDRRRQELIEHSVEHLLAQRINGLALGYEDLNDHNDLRRDPLLALTVGKSDLLGAKRREPNDRGKALAASATLNRLELAAEKPDARYRKIVAHPEKIEALLLEQGIKSIPRRAREIVLDFDATDDPLHGDQEGAYYHGYYKNYCYLPLYCFCGNIPLWAELRDCKRDASKGTVEALEKIVPAIRRRLGKKVRIIVRGDSGFARDAIMSWCESQKNVYYCFGMAKNSRLAAEIENEFDQLRQEVEEGRHELPCRAFKEFQFRTRTSWSCARRLVAKMEILKFPRFSGHETRNPQTIH